MKPVIISPESAHEAAGLVIAEEVRLNGKRAFRKGHRIQPSDIDTLSELQRPVHAVAFEEDDVHEDDAAIELATMIAGNGLTLRPPVQSRVNLNSAHRGLLRVDADAVTELNLLPGIAIFTTIDRLPVSDGQNVAGAKITPVAVSKSVLNQAHGIVESLGRPVITIQPFAKHTVGVLATEGLSDKIRDRFEATVCNKLSWYGSDVLRFAYLEDDPETVAETMRGMLQDGADLILTAGGNTIDPFDPTIRALPSIDARVIRLGAPAHPGSMFWYGSTNDGRVPIVNLASCSMYSQATVADLVLPWIMAGEEVSDRDLAGIGYGGLLDRDMQWRFPQYDEDPKDVD
jgi:hypothetical protein